MKIKWCLIYFPSLMILLIWSCQSRPDYTSNKIYFENYETTDQAVDSLLTCMTYNIQLGFRNGDNPWVPTNTGATKHQLAAIKKVLTTEKANIICLQEVPLNRKNSEIKDFIRTLAKELQMNVAFSTHTYDDPSGSYPFKGESGVAILTKFQIIEVERRQIDYFNDLFRRCGLRAKINLWGKPLNIYSFHYVPSEDAPKNTLQFLKERSHDRQIIMGDFNLLGKKEEIISQIS